MNARRYIPPPPPETVAVPVDAIEILLAQQRDMAEQIREIAREMSGVREHLSLQDEHLSQQDKSRAAMWKRIDEIAETQARGWPKLEDAMRRLTMIEANASGIALAMMARNGLRFSGRALTRIGMLVFGGMAAAVGGWASGFFKWPWTHH